MTTSSSFRLTRSLHALLDLNPQQKEGGHAVSLLSLGVQAHQEAASKKTTKRSKNWKGKQGVIDGINELIDELENIPTQIAQEGLDLIHANEVRTTCACV